MDQLPWGLAHGAVRSITHFNRLWPRDRTRALIADHLSDQYAQPVKGEAAAPPSPSEIAEKRD